MPLNSVSINGVVQADSNVFVTYLEATLGATNWKHYEILRPNLSSDFNAIESHNRTDRGGGTKLAEIDNETIFHRSPGDGTHTSTVFFQEPVRGSHNYRIVAFGVHTSACGEGRALRGPAQNRSYKIVWYDQNIVPVGHALRNNIVMF
ncbi:hypothetical protein [Rikenella microfusus]|uniref:hypothetical protein n=1 Tax=Rikenella microfusus TaxID=28139 RepID=UPI0011C06D87|nr:hypothetical protein [Rikenella microfusus]